MKEYYNTKAENRTVKLPTVISEKDFAELMKVTKKQHHRLAFKLAFLCGLRVSEIINLQKENFDMERRLIFVKQGKGNKDRYVPYPTKFITKKEVQTMIPLRCGVRALEIIFKKKVKQSLNREDLHFHNLRHSFATNLLNKGVPITDVQFWLGHSRLSTTSIYLKVSPDQALQRYENLWG